MFLHLRTDNNTSELNEGGRGVVSCTVQYSVQDPALILEPQYFHLSFNFPDNGVFVVKTINKINEC